MSDFAEINSIVRRRYETGDYGNAHLKVTPRLWGQMFAEFPRSGSGDIPLLTALGHLGDITGIPILVDYQLPPGTWRLVDNSSGNVLREGTVPAVSEEER